MDSKFHRKPNRLATASLFSKLFLFWVAPVLRTAYRKKTVEPHDLYACLPEDSTKEVGAQLSRNWNTQLGKTHPSLIYALTSTFGASFIFYGLGFLTEEVLRTFQPIFLKWLTEYFSPGSTVTRQQAYLYAGILGCSALFLALLHGPNLYVVQRMGMRVRVALCSLIYNHTLKLSYQSQGKTTAGKVHNLMTNDVNRFDQLFISLHYVWLGPLQAVIVLVLLFYEIGVASLPGYAVLLLIVPLNIWLGRIFTILRERTANFTDQRISIMTDIITAMRVIKMYAWEKPFGELVEKVRRSEIALIIEASYPISLNDTLGLFGSRLLDVGMIIFYTLTAPSIETARIFTVVSLCTTLRKSFLRMFPAGVQLLSECRVSLRRIEEYLTLEEKSTQPKCTSSLESPKENPHAAGKETQSADITVRHLTCSWRQRETSGTVASGEESSSHQLEDITFSVEAGTLLAVVGPVGVGKSSLLMAILGELPALRGEVQTSGRIAYVSQQPWVFGDTVRQSGPIPDSCYWSK